jgi:long-chain acyl-CoA synthetase
MGENATGQSESRTINMLLANSANKFGPKAALKIKRGDEYQGLTYSELQQKSLALGSFLSRSGIRKADRIAILCENRPEWAVVYFGILSSGAVVVGIDTRLKAGEIGRILSHSEAKILFTSSRSQAIAFGGRTISVDDAAFHDATARKEGITSGANSGDDLAMLVYTSGTTGAPKAVMLTHSNIVSNVLAAYSVLPAKSTDNFLSVLPLNHMLEVTGGLLGPLCCGATITYATSLKTNEIQAAMKETKTTILQGVPLLFELIHKGMMRKVAESIQPVPFLFSLNMRMAKALRRLHVGRILFRRVRKEFGGHIRFFVSGGAALNPEVARTFHYMGMPILEGYGLTETSPIVSVNAFKAQKIGSVGKPLPGVDVQIMDDGEIVVRGPNVMKGYYKDQRATDSVIRNREFYTGDIGLLDQDGFLYITGRKKNVIVTHAGKNIYPEEIEAVLGASPCVREICVIGNKQDGGERPFAFVIPDFDYFGAQGIEKDDLTVRQVISSEIRRLSEDLADYKRLVDFAVFKGEFPRTTTRKIKRHELQQIATQKAVSVEAEEVPDGFVLKLRAVVAKIADVPEESISPGSDLGMDLGIDSLLKIEILTAVDAEFGTHIPDELSYRFQTFADLVEFMRAYEKGEEPSQVPLEEEDEGYGFLEERTALRKFTKSCLYLFFRVLSKWYFGLEVKGAENIEGLSSFIITPNHNSLLDVPIVLSSLPRRMAEKMFSPAAKDYFFDRHPLRRWLIRSVFDTFPFERHGNFLKGLKKCKRTIQEGKSLILFPEGTRSVSGDLLPFKVGLGALAFDLDIPVVPTYIKGIHEAFGKGMLLPRPNKIEVRFGKPIFMDAYKTEGEGRTNYGIYKRILEDVRREILGLT